VGKNDSRDIDLRCDVELVFENARDPAISKIRLWIKAIFSELISRIEATAHKIYRGIDYRRIAGTTDARQCSNSSFFFAAVLGPKNQRSIQELDPSTCFLEFGLLLRP